MSFFGQSIPEIVERSPLHALWLAVVIQTIEDALANGHLPEAESARRALLNSRNVEMLIAFSGLPQTWADKLVSFAKDMESKGWVYDRPPGDFGNTNGQIDRLAKFSARCPEQHEAYRQWQRQKAEQQAAKREAKIAWQTIAKLEREVRDAKLEQAHARLTRM